MTQHRSLYSTAYWMRSNIPSLQEQAMADEVYDVTMPSIAGRLEDITNGAIVGRKAYRGVELDPLRMFSFKARTFFPALFSYILVPRIGNVPAVDENGEELNIDQKITFEFSEAYQYGAPTPGVQLPRKKLIVRECYIVSCPPDGPLPAQDGGAYTANLYCNSWREEWNDKPLHDFDGETGELKSWLVEADGLPGGTVVDHNRNLRVALGLIT